MSKPTIFGANALTGGADGALDSIDGADTADKDLTVVIDIDKFYPYQLDDDSAAAENSPLVISPDDNPGDKRWILKGGVFADLIVYGNVGFGTPSPNAPLEVKGTLPGNVGGFPSGLLHITSEDTAEFANSVITGHNSYNTNTQLWYLGSMSSSNNDICFMNRQNAALSLWTNAIKRVTVSEDGDVTFTENLVIGDGKTIGQVAGPLLTFDDTDNILQLSGANLNLSQASAKLTVGGAGWGKIENETILYLNYDNPTSPVQIGKSGNSLDFKIFGKVGIGMTALPANVRLSVDRSDSGAIPTNQALEVGSLEIQNVHASAVFSGLAFKTRVTDAALGLIGLEFKAGGDGDFFFRLRDGSLSSKEVLRLKSDGSAIVNGAISSGTMVFSTAGPTDDLDVSGINTLFIDNSSNAVTIGGFAGGVDGQVICVALINMGANNVTIEHNEPGATQEILLHAGADETLNTEYGGWMLVCHGGTDWHDVSHAKHV